MSYLLTEIAMEMLGWQFYDTEGVPRPINLEGLNLARSEGALSLEEALNIKILDQKLSVKAEADSSSIENNLQLNVQEEPTEMVTKIKFNAMDTIDQESYDESDDSKSLEIPIKSKDHFKWNTNKDEQAVDPHITNNGTNNSFNFKIESVVGGIDLGCDDAEQESHVNKNNFHVPLANTSKNSSSLHDLLDLAELNIKHLETLKNLEPEIKSTKSFASNWNVISTTKMPVSQDSAEPCGAGTSVNKAHTDFSATNCSNYELQQKLESEMFKTALDLNREKALYFKSLDNETKKNMQTFRKALEEYRNQECDNLQNELENLFMLRQHAEQLSAAKFPKTFPKYLSRSNALSNELLESANLTVPILGKTVKLKRNNKSLD